MDRQADRQTDGEADSDDKGCGSQHKYESACPQVTTKEADPSIGKKQV